MTNSRFPAALLANSFLKVLYFAPNQTLALLAHSFLIELNGVIITATTFIAATTLSRPLVLFVTA